jgi:hypothetical protein
MKKWVYVFGFIFLALLTYFTVAKVAHRAMPDYFIYLFGISAGIFFFLFIFAALQRRRPKD